MFKMCSSWHVSQKPRCYCTFDLSFQCDPSAHTGALSVKRPFFFVRRQRSILYLLWCTYTLQLIGYNPRSSVGLNDSHKLFSSQSKVGMCVFMAVCWLRFVRVCGLYVVCFNAEHKAATFVKILLANKHNVATDVYVHRTDQRFDHIVMLIFSSCSPIKSILTASHTLSQNSFQEI